MEPKDQEFLRKINDAKNIFLKVFRQAKKDIILHDEDDFLDSMSEHISQTYGLSEEDAQEYADIIYRLWEECDCSMTPFDRKITQLKEELFNSL